MIPELPGVPSLLGLDEAALRAAVRSAKSTLALPSFDCTPETAFVTVHCDDAGQARVAFLLNPSPHATRAELSLPGITRAVDALDGSEFRARVRSLEVPLPAQTTRILQLFS